MKKLYALILIVALAAVYAGDACAQFRIGPRVGVDINEMRLNKSAFDTDNRAGFTGGVQAEFTIPVINLGFDLSVMYVHRVSDTTLKTGNADAEDALLSANGRLKNRDYIELPLNFKYKIGLPVVGKVFTPYVFTGPSVSFLCSKKAINNAYENKSVDVAWNFGLGVQLFTHLQVSASYGLGMNKTVKYISNDIDATPISGKNNYWTVTAAWLF